MSTPDCRIVGLPPFSSSIDTNPMTASIVPVQTDPCIFVHSFAHRNLLTLCNLVQLIDESMQRAIRNGGTLSEAISLLSVLFASSQLVAFTAGVISVVR